MTPMQREMVLTSGEIEKTVGKVVVPIYPFLVAKAVVTNDKSLKRGLKAMEGNLIPNTIAWNEHFKRSGPVLLDKMRSDGRRLVLPEEEGEPA